jgi:hypothetical protein
MDPLIQYYKRQAGHGREDIGPIYSTPPFVQRGHGLGSVLVGVFRTLRPILWTGAKSAGKEPLKALGREALRTGGNIIIDIAENPTTQTKDIILKHVTASTQNIMDSLRGSGSLKRKSAMATNTRKVKRKRRKTSSKTIKRYTFS